MQDKFLKETIFSIDYSDLNKIISSEYDCPNYEVALEQPNDSAMTFYVEAEVAEYDEEDLQIFIETKKQKYNITGLLLDDLCRKGKIDPGKYLVNICW